MAERSRRWHYCLDDKILGYVTWCFCGWDAYLCTDKKWPNHQTIIQYFSATGSNTCWEARRAVEEAYDQKRKISKKGCSRDPNP